MKKILIPIATLAIFIVSSCSKNILDTAPNSSVASATEWTTDALTDEGVAGVYATLKLGYSSSGGATAGTVLYDIYGMDRLGYTGQDYGSNGVTDDGLNGGTATTSSALFTTTWTNLYEGIARANDAIVNMPTISPSDATKIARYVAECKFLRAYFYFRLNQVFKGVPVYLTPTNYDEFTNPITSYDSVWMVCINDLTDAINETNLPSFYAAGSSNYGHVTKGAAYALRGIIYQYRNMYDSAIADFQQVGSAGYALYNTSTPASDYKNLFKLANEQCAEMIFTVQNVYLSATWGYGGNMGFLCGTRNAYGGNGWDWYSASNELVDLYENADGTPFQWDDVISGYSAKSAAEREVYYIRDTATTAELTAAATRGASTSNYISVGNEARIAAAFANRDPRLAQTIITPYSTFTGTTSALTTSNSTLTMRWPYRSDVSYGDLRNDKTAYFLYWYRKFVPEGIELGTLGSDRSCNPIDMPLIRYADVLLRMAECYCEQGDIASALVPINLVRARAGMPSLQTSDATAGTYVTGQSDLRRRIRNERRVEFPNEGINYFDELRWGTWATNKFTPTDSAFSPVSTYSNGPKQIWGTLLSSYVYSGDYILRWPVPASVVQITNSVVAPTTGWTY
ncbi:MAG: RagB/SusD family nutrient uptake outer membrane protein [Chitinophagaceae bacterium]